jgi:pyrroline-5-carboxylate reductase
MAKPEPEVGKALLENWQRPLLLIGCGNMAGAMLSRWLDTGLNPSLVRVVRPSGKAVAAGVAVQATLEMPVAAGTLVLLGHKPQQLATVSAALAPLLQGADILSILAGVPVAQLREALPTAGTIIRCMPNLPVQIGAGVCLLHSEDGKDSLGGEISRLHRALGLVEWLSEEPLFDAATALSGCGPAFVYRMIDAMAQAGGALGLPGEQAQRLALATVEGAARSAMLSDTAPALMADAVASAGGMTRAGLDRLDQADGLGVLMQETLAAAQARAQALAALAKGG